MTINKQTRIMLSSENPHTSLDTTHIDGKTLVKNNLQGFESQSQRNHQTKACMRPTYCIRVMRKWDQRVQEASARMRPTATFEEASERECIQGSGHENSDRIRYDTLHNNPWWDIRETAVGGSSSGGEKVAGSIAGLPLAKCRGVPEQDT